MKKIKVQMLLLVLLTIGLFGSCEALRTAPYDQYSYQKAVEIKVDASRLMDKATTPYQDHVEAVEALLVDVEKMVIYEQNKPNNSVSFQMWELLSDGDKNLLAGFFKKWDEKRQLSPIFLEESKPQVIEAMDILIQYEGKKDKETENSLMSIILGNQ